MSRLGEHRESALFGAGCTLLAAGAVAYWSGQHALAHGLWIGAVVLGLAMSLTSIVAAIRRRQPSVDVIALLALAGALATGEAFAGAVITVMLASGALLEARAAARAKRELGLLVARAPRHAYRYDGGSMSGDPGGGTVGGGSVREVPVGEVRRGERLLVRPGDVVPVDGRLESAAVLDESALSGESLPVERAAGDDLRSGVVNAGAPFDLIATAQADESTYASVVRLVEQAQATSAPFVRTADRIAVAFVPLTLALAGLAWLISGDPVRAVAVLVVATPCPLLLAVPIAVMSGLSRCARTGVVVKGGAVLERLAGGRVLLFDKTGTLTAGQPVLVDVITASPAVNADDILRLAASVDQVSSHVVASAIVTAARQRGLRLDLPEQVDECHGSGLAGIVGDRRVRVGKAEWIVTGPPPPWVRTVTRRAALDGSLTVFVSVDGQPSGAFLLEDPIRPDAPRMIRALRRAGITRTVLVTGDRADVAETVGRIVGVDAVQAQRVPADKLAIVLAQREAGPTIMVGDGINDAPALAAADVGVALAARGATASSEAADVVLTVDRVDRLADAILIARRSRGIAREAVLVGMGLSLAAMIIAAAGFLPPAAGALLQEGIDILAIGIALRALLPATIHTVRMRPADLAVAQRLQQEHAAVRPVVEQVRTVADSLSISDSWRVRDLKPAQRGAVDSVRSLLARLDSELLPHERSEEELLMPIVAQALGGADPTGALSRTHAEIEQQVSRLRRIVSELDDEHLDAEDVVELRRLLYGLYAVLRLHNAQEEEGAFSLVPLPSASA